VNSHLMNAIAQHIYAGLGIISSDFINIDGTKSLMSKEYLLPEKVPFLLEDNSEIKNRVWGCQLSANQQEIKFLLADCSVEQEVKEYALLLSLKDAPLYGIYLISDGTKINSEIDFSINGDGWIEAPTYLQATFLAGMEKIRDIGFTWNKPSNYKTEFSFLISFIEFVQSKQ